MRQARYWLLTIPHNAYTPFLHAEVQYVKGQLEEGGTTGFLHWQVVVVFAKPKSLNVIKRIYGSVHAEPTRSSSAMDYVWKEDTRIDGTQFELGELRMHRNESKDWDSIKSEAQAGRLDSIPSDVYIRCYNSLKRIAVDHAQPIGIERQVFVFWGPTGTGKSRRAWEESGLQAYPKDPNSKFWDGYSGQKHVVIDEFRGVINISNVLRWFDRYPVLVEVKGSSAVLCAEKIWITSNLDPRLWYPELDSQTRDALMRRLIVIHFPF